MKTKLLTLSLLLMGISAGAQTVSVSISDDCSKNGKILKNGHECVDLGLSVKWATMNVGATAPEGFGKYFAWGETAEKSDYSWYNYKYCEGTDTTMITKYCIKSSEGTVDNKTTLELEDDAAHANWGSTWRMPTYAEWNELREQCTWTWTTQNGIEGNLVIAKNGNSIFLPAAGYYYGTGLFSVGLYSEYWTSSLKEDNSHQAYNSFFARGDRYWGFALRSRGHSIRPVCSK